MIIIRICHRPLFEDPIRPQEAQDFPICIPLFRSPIRTTEGKDKYPFMYDRSIYPLSPVE